MAQSVSFQFHNGTIKTKNGHLHQHHQMDFNSIMVQLKLVGTHLLQWHIMNFNSIVVQLKLIKVIHQGNWILISIPLRYN